MRPVLCIASSEAVGGDAACAIPAACAIELIHTYSLIHDDLPAMDNDEIRRGKPTCHIAFDEATAILSGDALLTIAFEILSEAGINDSSRRLNWLKIMRIISRASGCSGMIEGQMKDISSEGVRLDLKDLESLHFLKTGALIQASVESGALLGNGSFSQIDRLMIYAGNIGLAFQVTDDLLNVEGDAKEMGKATGTDGLKKKNTYPFLVGIEKSKTYALELVNNALQALEDFDNKSDPLRAIASYIIERKR